MVLPSYVQMLCVVVTSFVALTTAFVVPAPATRTSAPALYASLHFTRSCNSGNNSRRTMGCALRMSEEDVVEEVVPAAPRTPGATTTSDAAEQATQSVQSFFAPNENIRRGASKDQDGKSNVWAVEPKMRVEGKDVEKADGSGLVVTGALTAAVVVAIAATIALLPSPDSL